MQLQNYTESGSLLANILNDLSACMKVMLTVTVG